MNRITIVVASANFSGFDDDSRRIMAFVNRDWSEWSWFGGEATARLPAKVLYLLFLDVLVEWGSH